MNNFNIEEIRTKLNDSEYLLGLVKTMHGDDGTGFYTYPEEWSNLMISIHDIWNKAKNEGEMIPFSMDDFKLFLNGTVARIFKENAFNATGKTFAKAYECDKLSNLAWLPAEIGVHVFSQEDLIDALEAGMNLTVQHVCDTACSEVVAVLASKFMQRASILEKNYFDKTEILNKYVEDLQELKISRTKKSINREEFINMAKKLTNDISEQRDKISTLAIRKDNCMRHALYSSSIAANKITNQYTSQYNKEETFNISRR